MLVDSQQRYLQEYMGKNIHETTLACNQIEDHVKAKVYGGKERRYLKGKVW